MRKVIVGSRRSKLALTQTNWVIEQLKQLGAPFEFQVKEIVTKGDQILHVTLSKVGGKGLFVKEIEQAMLDGEIDFAVHSMKDMPAILPEGLTIGCVPKREDHRDVLISKKHIPFEQLPSGAIVGTSSLRRSAQLLAVRPDLNIQWIRGNIDTRLNKLKTDAYDAIILAAAGLHRMGWAKEVITQYLPTDVCVPAVGQGALAIECREDDEELLYWLNQLTDKQTERAVRAERAFLQRIEGGCQVPVAGYAYVDRHDIVLTALVATPNGTEVLKEVVRGTDPEKIGVEAAQRLIDRGAKQLIARVLKELE
ncbi:hydroxymethylbilane synthase [Anoxybacillus flavithermus]|uniref:Porphobilinogen deaminase n=1 Tax=Anoxybacillus flavithermus AK1 TaxID=1297581 RepID=M8DPI8_9BACL|nr:hydroxymethylbilane synthase [Anoxybacillus flavithermus]EMT46370.1 porphobilinogen deaminase [Anoxybacillus flavithermus AK1]